MPYIGSAITIPGLFKTVTLDYGKDQKKPMLQYKEDDKYKDIGYAEAYEHTELFALGLASMGVKTLPGALALGISGKFLVCSSQLVCLAGCFSVY